MGSVTYHKGGRLRDALAVTERSLALDPRNLDVMTKKGLCHQAMGALHEAFNTYNAVLVMNPSHVLALRAIGLLFQSHGLLTEAAEAFKRALEVGLITHLRFLGHRSPLPLTPSSLFPGPRIWKEEEERERD